MKGSSAVRYASNSLCTALLSTVNECSLRSANTGNSNNVYYVTTSGSSTNNNANNSYGVSLDRIIEDLSSVESKSTSTTETTVICEELSTLPKINKKANQDRRRRQLQQEVVPATSSDNFSYESLVQAAHECWLGVSWKPSVMRWKLDTAHLCNVLYNQLNGCVYKLSAPLSFELFSPKHRDICSLKYRDRVVQRCMCNNGLYYELTKGNIYDNCACQKGKGTQFAIERLSEPLRQYYNENGAEGWVLRLDISKFFDSIPHDKLKEMLDKKISNPCYKQMAYDVIDQFNNKGVGLGLGSQLSQLMAIAYLSGPDHYIKEQLHIKHYIRYSDDIVLIHKDKNYIKYCYEVIKDMLSKLGLKLNPKSTLHKLSQGIKFLKFKYILTDTGRIIIKPCKESITRARRRLFRMIKKGVPKEAICNSFNSWAAFVLQGNCYKQVKNLQSIIKGKLKYA